MLSKNKIYNTLSKEMKSYLASFQKLKMAAKLVAILKLFGKKLR